MIVWIIFLAALVFKLFWDKRAKDSGRIINHTQSAAIDGVIYALSIFFLSGVDYIEMGILFVLLCDMRWILFDIGFNMINGDKWNHTGNSSGLDVFLDKIDGAKDNVAKYGIFLKAIPIIIYICLKQTILQ